MDEQAFEEITANWQYQKYVNDCQIACLKSILDQLHRETSRSDLHFTDKELKKICNYSPIHGCSLDSFIPELNKELRRRGSFYYAIEQMGDKHSLDFLRGIISNPEASYPMIGVHSDYRNEYGFPIEGGRDLDHVINVVAVDENDVWFFDPYRPFVRKRLNSGTFKNKLSHPMLLQYWNNAYTPRWVVWFERKLGPLDRW